MRAAVLGHPVAHSLSPAMHRAAYAALGLDWTYEAVDVDVDDLDDHLAGLGDDVAGLSVTAPLKRRLVELASEVGPDARFLGVGNTWLPGGRVENTDVIGAVNALRERGIETVVSARVIGGGATAASMVLGLHRMGVARVQIVARNPATAAATVRAGRSLGIDLTVVTTPTPDSVDLVVSTIPPSAIDAPAAVAAAAAAFDVVYDPWPSPLATEAERTGKPGITGIDLLAHQATEQVHLMTARHVDAALLRAAALAALT